MHYTIGVLIFCVVSVWAGSSGSKKWDYCNTDKWKDNYLNCRGRSQSPINIADPICDKTLNNSIKLTNYEFAGSKRFTLSNNGYTLVVDPSNTSAAMELKSVGTFKLAQFHLHWGSDNTFLRGSEHTLNGSSFPAELHLVHYNTKHGSLGNAVNKSDGLAVLGIFIEAGKENPTFDKFLDFTSSITKANTNVSIAPFKMKDLLPENTDVFYRYSGSLTTPTCDESVTWTVFHQTIELSKIQLAKFRDLKDNADETLQDNYRTTLPLNGRKITYWNGVCSNENDVKDECPTSKTTDGNGAAAFGGTAFTLLLFLLFAVV